jgi:serine/threonine protein kinase/tetratricopeptide (TPR) repeat protein
MNREKWKTANEIFHAALDLPASERDSYVSMISAGDSEIELEVRRLLKADSEAGSYLETPIVPMNNADLLEPTLIPFQSGDILKYRFKIIRHVGQGGMGHVFEAFDLDLKVRIALKVIRPEIAANPTALDYFRREVRTARTITNANICRTFDFDKGSITAGSVSNQEYLFLTMEFLAGETLSERIRRDGRLPIPDALNLARQIASGLDSAHAVGIVHRDIKPANIMLVPASDLGKPTRAVIMDFGLARRGPLSPAVEDSAISHGALVGTLAYMAPEQLDPGEMVSPATDIYSFGLVLFEMVTGQRAFPSANLLSGIAQRLSGPPPSPLALAPHLTPEWEAAIQGCLRIDPAQRFQAASQVIQVLDGVRSALPPEIPPAKSLSRPPSLRSRRILIFTTAAVFLAAVSLSALWLRLHHQEEISKVAPGALVYLIPVKNQTGDRALDNLTELLQAGLSQSAQINLLDQSTVGDTLQLMTKPPDTVIDEQTARHIALRSGAVRVVFATVTGSAGSYSLNIDIQQPDATGPDRYRDHWSKSFTWTVSSSTANSTTISPDLLSAVRNSTDWIRYEVGESKNDIARLDTPPEDATTGNWQALNDLSKAQSLQRQELTVDAIASLRNAVAADPSFSLAWARLGDLLAAVGRFTESYQAYERALDSEGAQRLTRRERDRIKGTFALDSGDFDAAEAAFRDYSSYYEDSYYGWFYRGYPLIALGYPDAAIESLKRAYRIDPARGNAPLELARAYIAKGSLGEALLWAYTLRGQGDLGNEAHIEGEVLFLQHRYSDALASFQAQRQNGKIQHHARACSFLAMVYAEQGHQNEALHWLETGIQEDNGLGSAARSADKHLAKAFIEVNKGDTNIAMVDLDQAIASDASPQRITNASDILGVAMLNDANLDRATVFHRLLALGKLLPKDDITVAGQIAQAHIRGEILLVQGRFDAAILEFQKAAQLDVRINGQEALGRALDLASKHEHDPARATSLKKRAMEAYATMAMHPEYIWLRADSDFPGTYRGQLIAYLRVASELGDKSPTAQSAVCQFQSLTGLAAPSFPWVTNCNSQAPPKE